MKELELAPCPFCGGEAMFQAIDSQSAATNAQIRFMVKCRKCKVSLPGVYHTELTIRQDGEILYVHDDRERAVAVWNQRYVTKEEEE